MLAVIPPLSQTPRRIVCLVPSLTEALFAFGLGDRVVGITEYCSEPRPAVQSKPTIGGTKNPDVRAILRLAPDLVVSNVEENRQEDVKFLQAQGIPVFISFPQTVSDAIATLRALARVTGAEAPALPVIARIETAYQKAKSQTMQRRPPRVFCPIWKNPWMTINRQTFIHDMLVTCGGANIFAERKRQFPLAADLGHSPPLDAARVEGRDRRYPRVTLEEMAGFTPEIIVLPDEPYRFTEVDKADFAWFPHLPAVRDGRIYVVDGKMVCWYWSRLDESLRALQGLLLREG
jgi:ABC-type Fe3+-hydroxamate transport system substrate-binding protein